MRDLQVRHALAQQPAQKGQLSLLTPQSFPHATDALHARLDLHGHWIGRHGNWQAAAVLGAELDRRIELRNVGHM